MSAGRESRRGIWHSLRWWAGHHHARSKCGEYAPHDGAACHRDERGTGETRLHRQLAAEAARDEQRRKAKHATSKAARGNGSRAQLRDDVRLSQHAQELRAESYGLGYKKETAGFYGSDKVAQAEQSERRQRQADADREARARAEYEREERARYRELTKTEKWLHKPLTASEKAAEDEWADAWS